MNGLATRNRTGEELDRRIRMEWAVRQVRRGFKDVQEAALAQARRLTELPPRAFALTKRVLQTVPPSLESALELELIAQQSCFKSDEFMAGVAPFVRKPQA